MLHYTISPIIYSTAKLEMSYPPSWAKGKFYYPVDMTNKGNWYRNIISRDSSNWKEFHELLPVHLFTNHCICFERGNHVFKSPDYSIMLYTDVIWPMATEIKIRLHRNHNTMIHWLCSNWFPDHMPNKTIRDHL